MHRIITLIAKELRALWRDKHGRILLIAPVLLQLVIFSFAATLEVKNNTLALWIEDAGAESVELVQRLVRAQAFTRVLYLRNEVELQRTIDEQDALLALRFPQDFSAAIVGGRPATIQAILDGRRSNSAQIALSYVRTMIRTWQEEREGARAEISQLVVRHWFNPNLDYIRHINPSLVAIITTISTLVVTALSVAREREQGTLDQLLVSPLTPGMILAGKTIPAVLVASLQGTIILSAGVFVFGIPFRGSVMLLYASMVLYILSLAGFGLLISAVSSSQQQAFLGAFSFLMPAVLLSGFVAPVENMPQWLQYVDWLNPLRHFIVVVKGVFLKDATFAALWPHLYPLALIALGTFTSANLMFRRR
jgi:ABC-2 type transport system permease protein